MTPENFCYWLQGCLEISDPKSLDETEVQIIKDHLNWVFKKETLERRLPGAEIKTDQSKFLWQNTDVTNKNNDFFCASVLNHDLVHGTGGVTWSPSSYILGNCRFVRVGDTNEFKLDESYYTPHVSC